MRDWSELQHDMLGVIAQHLTKIEDYVAFGAVCTSWRAASSGANKNNFEGVRIWQQIPCLMLSAKDDEKDVDDREFYSLLEKQVVAKVSLPKLKGKKCMESLGWLLVIGEEGKMSLMNPFSADDEIPLPHQNTFPKYEEYETDPFIFVEKFVLSARPDETEDYAVMLICASVLFLAFWKPGDQSWNRFKLRKSPYNDVTYYNGKFYATDHQGHVVVCNLDNLEARILTRVRRALVWTKQSYIVESSNKDSLLLVIRDNVPDFEDDQGAVLDPPRYSTTEFKVLELDLSGGGGEEGTYRLKEIKRLGNRALFLGHSASTSFEVPSSNKLAAGIKPNHIYFTDDCSWGYLSTPGGGGRDMGVYNMETGTIEPFYHGPQMLSLICPSAWITPKF